MSDLRERLLEELADAAAREGRTPVTAVQALDQAGRAIARCTPGAPPVGDCRDTP
jgi:hypothetical protein